MNFSSSTEQKTPLSKIELSKPLNEVKNIRNFLKIIFESLDDKGILKFHYNHNENKKISFNNFRNIMSFLIFPLGLIPFKKRALSDSKLADILILSGFEIIRVVISAKYFYYTVCKDASLRLKYNNLISRP
jgi:hypothetical protein